MAIKDMFRWARTEWGIFSNRAEMNAGDRVRWVRQWVPFGMRTIGYGTLSITLGPFTKGAASVWAARQWSQASARGLNIRFEASGLENTPADGFVFASNHQSLIDILVLGAVLPGDFKWAAKRSVMHVPFLGWHLRLAGHVPVDRQKGAEAARAVGEAFERVLRDGKPLLVFPEGTRSEDGQVKPFKNGGFLAAVRARCPVVPVALEGTHALMSRDEVDTGKMKTSDAERTVLVEVGVPIYPDESLEEPKRVADLRDRCRRAVVSMHQQLAARRQALCDSSSVSQPTVN